MSDQDSIAPSQALKPKKRGPKKLKLKKNG